MQRRFDSKQADMVKYARFWTKVQGRDIVLELIGNVKLLRVSRRSRSTPERGNKFACCKAVVSGNLRNFVRRYLAEKVHAHFLSSYSLQGTLRASREIRKRGFSFLCPIAWLQTNLCGKGGSHIPLSCRELQ